MTAVWKSSLMTISLMICVATTCHASGQSTRSECSQAAVQSLKVNGVTELAFNSSIDFCAFDSPAIPSQLLSVLTEVKIVRDKVISTFGLPASVLFPQDFNIFITATEGLGSLDEWADANNIYISVFSAWNGEPFDQAMFAHELGHVIAAASLESQLIRDLRSIPILSEGFSDLVAYGSYGIGYETNGVPQPIIQLANRPLNPLVTFNQSLDFFLETHIYDALNSCILTLSPTDRANTDVRSILAWAQAGETQTGFSTTFALRNNPFSAETCRQLNGPIYSYSCDPHQLSQPFTSFLVALGKQIGKNLVLEAIRLLVSSTNGVKTTYSCSYNSASGRANPVVIELNTFDQLIQTLQSGLGAKELVAWNSLWSQAGLDAAINLSSDYVFDNLAPNDAYTLIQSRYATSTDPFFNSSNPCFVTSSSGLASVPDQCKITCSPQPKNSPNAVINGQGKVSL